MHTEYIFYLNRLNPDHPLTVENVMHHTKQYLISCWSALKRVPKERKEKERKNEREGKEREREEKGRKERGGKRERERRGCLIDIMYSVLSWYLRRPQGAHHFIFWATIGHP